MITIESADWHSILEKDPYFESLEILDEAQFCDRLSASVSINAVDAAKAILSMTAYCPLKLQMLLYYSQKYHLAKTGKPLFPDLAEEGDCGSVTPEVFRKYGKFGSEIIPAPAVPAETVFDRFCQRIEGESKYQSIRKTVALLKDYTPNELVSLSR